MFLLFDKYIGEGKVFEALVVGQNLVNKNCTIHTAIKYIDYLIKLSDESSLLSQKLSYINRADTILEYFAENAELNEAAVTFIKEYKGIIESHRSSVSEQIQAEENAIRVSKEKYNSEALALIERLANNIATSTDEAALNRILDNIKKVDASIETAYLTAEQSKEYERLTTKCSDAVTKKIKDLEEEKNRDYNIRAVEAFDKAFRLFKNAETSNNMDRIITDFLSFDASRLTAETMLYYNHVYSFIFSKLSDEEKFAFTKKAILLQKRSKQ